MGSRPLVCGGDAASWLRVQQRQLASSIIDRQRKTVTGVACTLPSPVIFVAVNVAGHEASHDGQQSASRDAAPEARPKILLRFVSLPD